MRIVLYDETAKDTALVLSYSKSCYNHAQKYMLNIFYCNIKLKYHF